MELTLGDLLDHPDLDLRLVTGDSPATRACPVHGAHPIEIPATPWVPPGWVMLTNGLRLRGRPHEQRQLIAELDTGGQAALGWAVGTVMQRIPRALVDEARRRAFPVFLVPIETAFHEIVSFVGHARAHDEVQVVQRVAAMEGYLLDALAAVRPEQAVVRRLASVLETQALLTTVDGAPVESSGPLPSARVRAAIADRDTSVDVHPVRVPDESERLLVLPDAAIAESVRPLVRRAVQLLELLARRDSTVLERANTRKSALLLRCLDQWPEEIIGADAEAATLGIQIADGAHATVWADGSLSGVRAVLDSAGFSHMVADHNGTPVALVQALPAEIDAAFAESEIAGHVMLGIGSRIDTMSHVGESATAAHVALLARPSDAPHRTVTVYDLDPLARMLVPAASQGLLDDLRALLDPLRNRPHLIETVACWLDVSCDINRAAGRLHVHRNTLRYRLGRIEQLTGLGLTAPRTAANLSVALLADRLCARLRRPPS